MSIKVRNTTYLIFFLIVIFFCSTNVLAQKKIKVHAKGTSISLDKTPKNALKDALKDAKEKALKKAGIKELVSVSRLLIEESSINDYKKRFSEFSSIESNANIIVDSVYTEKRSFDEFGNMIIIVEIDATVFKYKKKKDSSFFFKIDGLKDVYYENEHISFSFTPSQEGHLTIFVLNEKEALLLYPFEDMNQKYLSDVKNKLFKKNEKINFPIHQAFKPGYSIELENKNKDEISNFIFVFTKNNYSWIEGRINKNTILNWIYKIPLDEREIVFRSILLKNLN